jgi:SET domain-containing protein
VSDADPVEVRTSPLHGRGLYATRALRHDEVVVEAPALILEADEVDALAEHRLASYLVAWDEERAGVPFGVVSFTNHAPEPNAHLVVDHDALTVSLVTLRRVAAGEELTIDYGEDHPV